MVWWYPIRGLLGDAWTLSSGPPDGERTIERGDCVERGDVVCEELLREGGVETMQPAYGNHNHDICVQTQECGESHVSAIEFECLYLLASLLTDRGKRRSRCARK